MFQFLAVTNTGAKIFMSDIATISLILNFTLYFGILDYVQSNDVRKPISIYFFTFGLIIPNLLFKISLFSISLLFCQGFIQ